MSWRGWPLLIEVTRDILTARYRVDVEDNLAARRVQTQFQMVHRMAVNPGDGSCVAVGLMTFPRSSTSASACWPSAGVASLVIGMARRTRWPI